MVHQWPDLPPQSNSLDKALSGWPAVVTLFGILYLWNRKLTRSLLCAMSPTHKHCMRPTPKPAGASNRTWYMSSCQKHITLDNYLHNSWADCVQICSVFKNQLALTFTVRGGVHLHVCECTLHTPLPYFGHGNAFAPSRSSSIKAHCSLLQWQTCRTWRYTYYVFYCWLISWCYERSLDIKASKLLRHPILRARHQHWTQFQNCFLQICRPFSCLSAICLQPVLFFVFLMIKLIHLLGTVG